ncbi:MAG: signal peptidase II [Rhodobacteraceae bacterium]|nr:signal peptidase II [Paracoccaceae bacterium]
MRLAALVAGGIFLLDQATKLAVVQGLDLIERGGIDVWPPFLTLRMAWNRGINFGLFAQDHDVMRWVLIVIALTISAWVWLWIRREGSGRWPQVSAGFLIGGALGNVVDRLIYGAVADFLNMSCCGIQNPYAFNVADIAIFAGALDLVIFSGKSAPDPKTKQIKLRERPQKPTGRKDP